MSDERKRENEEGKLKDFFHNVIGIKSEAVLEVLAENSEICNLKARTLLMKENEKVDAISFLYKKGGLVKSYYEKSDGKKQVHCFAHFPGEALVGIMNLDKQITSFLTVELITDCEIVRISADVLRKLAMENIEIALVCNSLSVISLVLIGACFHTIFITSNSASEICGKSLISNPSLNLTDVINIL